MIIRQFACALFYVLLASMPANAQNQTPVGIWLDKSERIAVRIVPCGDRLCGNIFWFKWPNDDEGLPLVDLKNTDPTLRTRPLLGLSILYGLRRTDEDAWEGGKIYDPDDGENYHARMSLLDGNTLRVRVYDIFPLFGETQIWTRIR